MKAVSRKPPNLSMQDELWPFTQTETILLGMVALFYLGLALGLAMGGGR